jgi:hypothetical protein
VRCLRQCQVWLSADDMALCEKCGDVEKIVVQRWYDDEMLTCDVRTMIL